MNSIVKRNVNDDTILIVSQQFGKAFSPKGKCSTRPGGVSHNRVPAKNGWRPELRKGKK